MPRHPPNTLKTLDQSRLQRPTPGRHATRCLHPDAQHPNADPGSGTSSALYYPVSTTGRPTRPGPAAPPPGVPGPDTGSPGLRSSPCPTADKTPVTRTSRTTPTPASRRRGELCFRDRTGAPNGTPGTGMVGQGRLELPTSRLSSARSNQLSYWPRFREGSPARPSPTLPQEVWWRRTGSNRRPAACKAAALPAELRPHAPTRHPEQDQRSRTRRRAGGSIGKGCAGGGPEAKAA